MCCRDSRVTSTLRDDRALHTTTDSEQEAMSTDYSRALGARLRAIRNQQGLSLQGVEDKSHGDRKSTRLNSSHANISYAVFCLKKKKHMSLTIRCNHEYQQRGL